MPCSLVPNGVPGRRTLAALIVGLSLLGSANARYRCDNPPSAVDRRACAWAEQGPDQLRRFIERMRPFHSMYFPEYVNEARLIAWQESEGRSRAIADEKDRDTARVARSARR